MDKYLKALEEIERIMYRRDYNADYDTLDRIKEVLNDLKHCPKCDEWIDFSDRFCRSCGHKIGADE